MTSTRQPLSTKETVTAESLATFPSSFGSQYSTFVLGILALLHPGCLRLILQVISELGQKRGITSAFLTNDELARVVIPLAGARTDTSLISENVDRYRRGTLDVSDWPDCVPAANDLRMSREFLLFLANFGILRHGDLSEGRDGQRFSLRELFDVAKAVQPTRASIFASEKSAQDAVEAITHSNLPSIVERQRVLSTMLVRTGQGRFRARIMKAYQGRCFLTDESIPEVLEAAHIVPVRGRGWGCNHPRRFA